MVEKIRIENFFRLWNAGVERLLEGYIYDEEGKLNPTRYIFSFYLKLIERFLNSQIEEIEKINLLSGIRGVGKTTLLAQIFYASKFIRPSKSKNYLKALSQDYLQQT